MADLPQQDDHLARARLLTDQKRWRDAEKILREALSKDPNCPEKLYLLAFCQLEQNQVKLAEETAMSAIAAGPDHSNGFFILARVYIEQEYYEAALEINAEALKLKPESVSLHYQRAYILDALNKSEAALDALNTALSLNPNDSDSLAFRSLLLQSLNRQEEARENAEKSLHENPDNWFAFYSRGHALLQENKNKEAYDSFREALRLEPNNDHARKGMLETLRKRYLFYRMFSWLGKSNENYFVVYAVVVVLTCLCYGFSASSHNFWVARLQYFIALPFIYLMICGWMISHLSNLLVMFHPIGRLALTIENKIAASVLAICHGVGLLCIFVSAGFDSNFGLRIGYILLLLSLPITEALSQHVRRKLYLATALLLTYFVVAVYGLFVKDPSPFLIIYILIWPYSTQLYSRNLFVSPAIGMRYKQLRSPTLNVDALETMRRETFLFRWLKIFSAVFEHKTDGLSLFTSITGLYCCGIVILSILMQNLYVLGAIFIYLGVIFFYCLINFLAKIIADFILLFNEKGRCLLSFRKRARAVLVSVCFFSGLIILPVGFFLWNPYLIFVSIYLIALLMPIKEVFRQCRWWQRLRTIVCVLVLIACAGLSSMHDFFRGLFITIAASYYLLYWIKWQELQDKKFNISEPEK